MVMHNFLKKKKNHCTIQTKHTQGPELALGWLIHNSNVGTDSVLVLMKGSYEFKFWSRQTWVQITVPLLITHVSNH